VYVFEPKIFGDDRGYFFESFRYDVFKDNVGDVHFVQENQSKSSNGVLRGLHFQRPPATQSKLVTCIQGEVLDVAVDIRIGSPTFGEHVSVNLNEENKRQLWIPKGFAHGFVVLSQYAVFAYKCDNYYAPSLDGGIYWNDPSLKIDWKMPTDRIKLSEKDLNHPLLSSVDCFDFKDFNYNQYK
jgi:dTDP-4-dehydrorhamnose 3,5-epimerase